MREALACGVQADSVPSSFVPVFAFPELRPHVARAVQNALDPHRLYPRRVENDIAAMGLGSKIFAELRSRPAGIRKVEKGGAARFEVVDEAMRPSWIVRSDIGAYVEQVRFRGVENRLASGELGSSIENSLKEDESLR